MRVDPVIAALRGDRAPQRQAQAAMVAACDAWRLDTDVAPVLAGLQAFGAGAPIEACPGLEAAFAGPDGAQALTDSLCRQFAAAIGEEILGHPAFRHGFDARGSTLLLARSGRAQLTLHALEPGRSEPMRASFSDALRYDAVLAGEAEARIVRGSACGERMELFFEPLRLSAGTRLSLDLASEALQVLDVERRLVTLRLMRQAADPAPTRAYDITDGRMIGQASGDIRTSRQEMMLALLGRMKCTQAAPEMAAIACEPGSDALRWQALHECLALDTAEGFRALVTIARTQDDPLAAPAGALRAQLIEAHPQLLALETCPCPG